MKKFEINTEFSQILRRIRQKIQGFFNQIGRDQPKTARKAVSENLQMRRKRGEAEVDRPKKHKNKKRGDKEYRKLNLAEKQEKA